jgi:hypothetical protein
VHSLAVMALTLRVPWRRTVNAHAPYPVRTVSNPSQCIEAVRRHTGATRVFTFGIGQGASRVPSLPYHQRVCHACQTCVQRVCGSLVDVLCNGGRVWWRAWLRREEVNTRW